MKLLMRADGQHCNGIETDSGQVKSVDALEPGSFPAAALPGQSYHACARRHVF